MYTENLQQTLVLVGDGTNAVVICNASPCFKIFYSNTQPFYLNVTGVKFIVAGAIVQTNSPSAQVPIHINFSNITCVNSLGSSASECSGITMFLLSGVVKSVTLRGFSARTIHTLLQLQDPNSYVESLALESVIALCIVTCVELRSISITSQLVSVMMQGVDLNSNAQTTVSIAAQFVDSVSYNGSAVLRTCFLRGDSSAFTALDSLTIQDSNIFATIAIQNVRTVSIRDSRFTGDRAVNRIEFVGCATCDYNVTVDQTSVLPTTRSAWFMNFGDLAHLRVRFTGVLLKNLLGAVATSPKAVVASALFEAITLNDAFLLDIAVASGPVTINGLAVTSSSGWTVPNSVIAVGAMTNNYALTVTNVQLVGVALRRGFLSCGNTTDIAVINTVVESCRALPLQTLPVPMPTVASDVFAAIELRGMLPVPGVLTVRNSTFSDNALTAIRAAGSNVEIITSVLVRNEVAVSLPMGGTLKIDAFSCLCPNNATNVQCSTGRSTTISDSRANNTVCNDWLCSCVRPTSSARTTAQPTSGSATNAKSLTSTTELLSGPSPLLSDTTAIIIGASIGGGLLLVAVAVLVIGLCRRRQEEHSPNSPSASDTSMTNTTYTATVRPVSSIYDDAALARSTRTSQYEDIADVRQ